MPISQSECTALTKAHQKKALNIIKDLNAHVSRNASSNSFGQTHRDALMNPTSPGGASVFSGVQDGAANGGPSFSGLDAELSLAQQEFLEKYNLALRRLVQLLEDSNKTSTISAETKASNVALISFATGLVKNISASSTVLTQMGLIIEDSMAKQKESLAKQSELLTGSLISIGADHWSSVNENISKLLSSDLPLVMIGSDFDSSDGARSRAKIASVGAQLKKVFQLAATFQINQDNFGSVLQESIAREYQLRAMDGYNSLLNIVKNIIYDKMSSQLEKTVNQVRIRVEETEKEKLESGLVSPLPQSADHQFPDRTSSRISQGFGVDVSSLNTASNLVKSQPLQHVSKPTRTASGTGRRPPTRTVRSTVAPVALDDSVKNEEEPVEDEPSEPVIPATRQRKPSLMESMLVADLKSKVLQSTGPRKTFDEILKPYSKSSEESLLGVNATVSDLRKTFIASQPVQVDLVAVAPKRSIAASPPEVPKLSDSNRNSVVQAVEMTVEMQAPAREQSLGKESLLVAAPPILLANNTVISISQEQLPGVETKPLPVPIARSRESLEKADAIVPAAMVEVLKSDPPALEAIIVPIEAKEPADLHDHSARMGEPPKQMAKNPIIPQTLHDPVKLAMKPQLASLDSSEHTSSSAQPRATNVNVPALRDSVASSGGSRDSLHSVDKETHTGAEKNIQSMKVTLSERSSAPSPRAVDDVRGSSNTDESKSQLKNQLSGMLMMPRPAERPISVASSHDDPPAVPSPTTKHASPIKESALAEGISSIKKVKHKGLGSKLGGLFKRKDKKHDEDSDEGTPVNQSPMVEKKPLEAVVVSPPASVVAEPEKKPLPGQPAVAARPSPTRMGIKLPMGPAAGEGGLRKTVYEQTTTSADSSAATSPPEISNSSTESPTEESPAVGKKKFMTATPLASLTASWRILSNAPKTVSCVLSFIAATYAYFVFTLITTSNM